MTDVIEAKIRINFEHSSNTFQVIVECVPLKGLREAHLLCEEVRRRLDGTPASAQPLFDLEAIAGYVVRYLREQHDMSIPPRIPKGLLPRCEGSDG